jgi:hypothetical protein
MAEKGSKTWLTEACGGSDFNLSGFSGALVIGLGQDAMGRSV